MSQTTVVVLSLIGFIVMFGIVAQMQAGYVLKKWLEEIRDVSFEKTAHTVPSKWIQKMMEDYEQYRLSGAAVNSQTLVEKHFFQQPIRLLGILQTPVGNIVKMLQQLPSFSIILGVLGTFVGLTLSMFSMQETLLSLGSESPSTSVSNIVSSISAPFQGMSIAFITSIAGIGGALLLSIFQAGFLSRGNAIPYLQAKIASECEFLLDHEWAAQLNDEKPQDMLEKLLDRLVNKVQESFQKSVGDFGEEMTRFTEGLQHAMEEVQHILIAQREHSETFAESTGSLEHVSERFLETSEKLGNVHSGMTQNMKQLGEKITHFEKQVSHLFQKQDGHHQRFEQMVQRSDIVIEQSTKKTQEIAESFLRAMDQQLQQYNNQYDIMERNMQQQNDDWFYRYQEKQDHYHRAADAFSGSVQQLEKAMFGMVEKVRRDISDQINLQRERESRMNMGHPRDEMKEVTRTIELLYQGIGHDFKDIQRYLEQFYQILQRIYDATLQSRSGHSFNHENRRTVPSRVIE